MLHRRLIYVALALCTIAIGLVVHFRGDLLAPMARDILGDGLWAAMIVWWISALAPSAPRLKRYGFAYAICVMVETSQAFHTPLLDAARAHRLGQLVLGSGFDPRDFVAYAAGVIVAACLDVIVSRRSLKSS